MLTGTVTWFNHAKGCGFIEAKGGADDVFAHFSAVQTEGFRSLKQGERVSDESVQRPKGALAQNIPPLASTTPAPAASIAAPRDALAATLGPGR